jgi:Bacterial Ig domain
METTHNDSQGPTRRPQGPARRASRVMRTSVAIAAALALLAAGCGDDDDDTTAGGSGESGGGSGGAMTVDIVSPSDGDEVGTTFDVEVDPSVDIGEPDTGLHHVHLYYDGNTAEGEYDLVYEPTVTVDRLDPGEHTIEAVIANADHSLTDARSEITVTVSDTATGGGGSDDTTETTADSGGGY